MRIGEVELLEGIPVLYIKKLSAIVCSDLHLGYEGVMADKGTFLPKANLKNIKKTLKKAAELTNPVRIIIDGDIKNEFSDVHVEEFNEFHTFTKFIREELKIKNIDLIKGNHDNFIDRLEKPLGVKIYRQEALIDEFLFFHGEELPHNKEAKTLIMGHLHPAIGVYNKIGVREKLKCFLHGKINDGREIIILPAMNFFAEGVEVNIGNITEHAPILENLLDINNTEAICIGEGELLDFGKVKDLRKIASA